MASCAPLERSVSTRTSRIVPVMRGSSTSGPEIRLGHFERLQGERDDEPAPQPGRRQAQSSLVLFGDPACDGEAETAAGGTVGVREAHEPLENSIPFSDGDARTRVFDAHGRRLLSRADGNVHVPAVRGVSNRVVQQVHDHAAEQLLISLELDHVRCL